jgi:putative inorganic carbon (HCO3(-)) transporter
MLRTIFVFGIIAVGVFYAAQGPFYALLFYLWNAYFRPEEWVWDPTIRSLSLSFIIGVYLVATSVLSARQFRLNLRTGLILLFFLQTLVSTVTSEHFDLSWSLWVEFSKVMLVSYLIVVLVDDQRRFRLALVVIALSLGFECAKQGWAQLILNPGAQNNNSNVFLGDNNGVAVGTMMLLPILGALAYTATRSWEANLFRFLSFGVFMRGITTYSRGGFISAGVLAFISFLRSPHKIRLAIAFIVVATLVNTVMPKEFWDRMNTINAPAEQRDDSAAGRLHFWQVAIEMANEKPLTGVGFRGFEASYLAYNRSGEFGGVRATHSVWFGLLSEMGYPGLFLFVAIWSLSIRSCWRISRSGKHDPARRELGLYANGLLVSLIVFGVGGTFLADQYNEMLWHFIGLSAALHVLATSEVRAAETEKDRPSEPQPVLAPS